MNRTLLNDGFDLPNPSIRDLDLVYSARGADPDFLPVIDSIPQDFEDKASWDEFHKLWFFTGLPAEGFELYPREGIDPQQAWNHLAVVKGCFGSKHEHKMVALSWLASRWFTGYAL